MGSRPGLDVADLAASVKIAKKTILGMDPTALNSHIGKTRGWKKDYVALKSKLRVTDDLEGYDEQVKRHNAVVLLGRTTFCEAKLLDQLCSRVNSSNKALLEAGVIAALVEVERIFTETADQKLIHTGVWEKCIAIRDAADKKKGGKKEK